MKNFNRRIQPITTSGIYHNSDLGLISLSSDGTTRITIADKNLGATTVYNSGDTLSEANCGKFYQRGNNYGFPFTGATTTSSSAVNAGTYGPGNYYSSSTFIFRGSYTGWDSSNNQNLWGGVIGTNEAMQGPCESGYHIPKSTEFNVLKNIMSALGLSDYSYYSTMLKIPRCGELDEFNGNHIYSGQSTRPRASEGGYSEGWRYCFQIESGSTVAVQSRSAAVGQAIRPFKNETRPPYEGETGWTKLNS